MSRYFTVDRPLILASAVWLAALWQLPELHSDATAFCVTVGVIAVNTLMSLSTLTRTRQILIGLNCSQIVLFGVLGYQLYRTFGVDHYRCDREPLFYDWVEFTVAHIIRAADVLHALDEYGIEIQTISHNSTASALVLVAMHLTVDGFLLGLLLRWIKRSCTQPVSETRLQQGRREFGWILVSAILFVGFVVSQRLQPSDWLLWPLDNLLRLIDVGDVMQLFGWRLHGVEPSYWSKGASVLFRLAAGIWMARLVILWRLTVFRTWGLSIEELTKLLDDPDGQMRCNAATGLGRSGPDAHGAVPALIAALHDVDPAVRVEAAWALGQIGPAAHSAVPRLIDAAWLGARRLRHTAADALGRIGNEAHAAVHPLVCLLKVSDRTTRRVVTHALMRIAPNVIRNLPTDFGARRLALPEAPISKRHVAWQRSVEAAQARNEMEASIRTQILTLSQRGFFTEEQDTELVQTALAANGHPVELTQLFMPLFQLSAEGELCRRRNDQGEWVYRTARG
jgi:hypothetical protein